MKLYFLFCVHNKTSKFDKPSVRQGLKAFRFDLKHRISQSRTPETSETLLSVTLVKRRKAVRKSPEEPNSDVAGIDNGPLTT